MNIYWRPSQDPQQVALWKFQDSIRVSDTSFFVDIFLIPTFMAGLSAFFLIIQSVAAVWRKWLRRASADTEERENSSSPQLSKFGVLIVQHGGNVFFIYSITRFLGTLGLLGLTIRSYTSSQRRRGEKGYNLGERAYFEPGVAMLVTCIYSTLLALLAVLFPSGSMKSASKHLNVVLLSILAVYTYRDLFPLATYSRPVLDIQEGPFLWAKIAALVLTGVIFPFVVPRRYIPVDPKNPTTPNAEQTASLLSLILFTFLDPVISFARKNPRLSHDQLPPLADYDDAKNLRARSFTYLDPMQVVKKRHPFLRLLRVFGKEYSTMAFMLLVQVGLSFAYPIGLQQILRYLETGGKDATIRPWFWIVWLVVGPFCSSLAWQFYIYFSTMVLVRLEAVVTQLVFEHSLRIRMKTDSDEESKDGSRGTLTSPSEESGEERYPFTDAVPDSSQESIDPFEVDTLQSQENTLQESSSSVKSSTSVKRSPKVAEGSKDAKPVRKRDSSNLVGKINNLITSDLENMTGSILLIITIPLEISGCIVFLYYVLGWSAFVGFATILLLSPIPGYLAKLYQGVQLNQTKATDSRVQEVTETMNILRMVKFFGWESKMIERLNKKREQELTWVWKRQVLQVYSSCVNSLIPVVTMLTMIMKQPLSASIVFSSITVFDMLEGQLHFAVWYMTYCISANVSFRRLGDFLYDTELLDTFSEKDPSAHLEGASLQDDNTIGFRDAAFAWSSYSDGYATPSERRFTLRIEGELLFRRGCLNLIIGPTGSGKTSLLMSLLGEMHFLPSGPSSWFNLPRVEGIAYAAQESWVLNDTIKNNILFGAPFDEVRYKKVLYQCSLERDLGLFAAGDETEVGEKGLTLSGGQKARVTLARAVYSSASILLLDDILAALDIHTANWIVSKCLSGDLLHDRTVLLVTHNVALVHSIAEFVVSMSIDGSIAAQGLVSDPHIKAILPSNEGQIMPEHIEIENETSAPTDTRDEGGDGKLIVEEEIDEGRVSWEAFMLYLRGLGGSNPRLFFTSYTFLSLLSAVITAFQTWYLGYWASQYENRDPSTIPVVYYLTIYGIIIFGMMLSDNMAYITYLFGILRASRKIHEQLITAVMGTTLRWLDVTPVSRVITRCTRDIKAVDSGIPYDLMSLCHLTLNMLVKIGAVVLFTPSFLVPAVLVFVAGRQCGQIYIAAQLPIKRQMSNAKAPVLGHFGAAIAGLTSIRAYGVEKTFKAESLERINRYNRAARVFYNLNRWIALRTEALGDLFAASLATYLVYFKDPAVVNAGFSLNMAVGFSSMILWWVRSLNDFEVEANSLERIQGYLNSEQEPKSTEAGKPPAHWPASGELRVETLSAKYSQTGPKVLHDISFDIKSGERIGVVGRTGSGKSSLTLALLRCIITEGGVYYDGYDTEKINLDALRSNITIIPQSPELISGSLRFNLDPFDQHDDATLNDALRAAGLFSLQTELEEGQITLDTSISSGGGNLSVGQKQIIALARAMIRGSKLFILDEATSAIDHKTDTVIQSSIRQELPRDVTVITIAHRLQTIMDYDKIMVLDAGRIVEFDTPRELLKRRDGKLRNLVDESGDRELLYAMANATDSL